METLTITFPKIQTKTFSLTIRKKHLVALTETITAALFFSAVFIWLLI